MPLSIPSTTATATVLQSPLAAAGKGAGVAAASPGGGKRKPKPGAFHILIVDDQPINRRILGRMLDNLGYLTSFAHDGKQACAAALNSSDKFDLIFMDIVMPVMDGLQATLEIRAGGFTAPIVALTANAMTGRLMSGCAARCCSAAPLLDGV